TLSGGNWLTVTPSQGRSEAFSTRIPSAEVAVTVAGLPAGQYNGSIRVLAEGANNSPQTISVLLEVLPPGSTLDVRVSPSGLIFSGRVGESSPSSQLLRLATASSGGVEVLAIANTSSGGNWLQILPDRLIVSPGEPRTITVQPLLTNLTHGVYRGTLNLLFKDGTATQVVEVIFLVRPGATAIGPQEVAGARIKAVEGCAPTRLYAVIRTVAENFSLPVGWPSLIEAQVADDCGEAAANATVVTSFSNGDPPLVLSAQGNGFYLGNWRPGNVRDQLVITLRAELPPLSGDELRIQGHVRATPSAPALFAGGVVNGASFAGGQPVAPGGIIAVFGRNLAQGLSHSSQVPLERSLGGATLNIGGINAPLFFASESQINAQVPVELTPNTRPHVVLRTTRGTDGAQTLTVPETITIAEARPAIFAVNEQGSGQGVVLNQDNSANSAANAAARGSVVQIFATGLGPTNPAAPSGNPAPAAPPAAVTKPVTATVGGVNALVHFAGLAPGYVGLYQVNVEIPAGIQPGAETPLVLLQSGVPSNTVTLAVR
ncbi:MAG: hypothetical protein ACRD88_17720, partial [Terriglobia bacterium]